VIFATWASLVMLRLAAKIVQLAGIKLTKEKQVVLSVNKGKRM
jgi:hypothetical protein